MSLNATREAVLPVLVGGGGADKAGADENTGADDEACHLLGEMVLGGAIQVVPRTVRLRARGRRRERMSEGGSGEQACR